jgi:hypothetical protein
VTNLGQSMWFWAALLSCAIFLYVLPLIIAAARGVKGLGYVVLFTVLTLVLPVMWLGALILAVFLPRSRQPQRRYVATL